MAAIRAMRASQTYDEAYEMRRPVRPTQTVCVQVNRFSMPGYAATGSEEYPYSEIPDPLPAPLLPGASGTISCNRKSPLPDPCQWERRTLGEFH
jgi:hypothetical protein